MGFSDELVGLLNGQATATALGVASRTGLLAALGPEPSTVPALAERSGVAVRYCEEILAVLVCGKVVVLEDGEPLRYTLPQERKEALDGMGLYFEELPLLSQCAFSEVTAAAKTGAGVDARHYGPFGKWMGKLANEKHARQLVQTFLPALADGAVVRRLQEGGARVLDLGCGEGAAVHLMAEAFPQTEVVGVDIDPQSVQAAAAATKTPNATFQVVDICSGMTDHMRDWEGTFDLVTAFDAIHDLTNPSGALQAAQRLLKPDTGVLAMVDIRAGTGLRANLGHSMAPFLYTVSLLHCMPQGLRDHGPGLGMMWGREKALELLRGAGFSGVEVVEMHFDAFNDCYLCKK